MRNCWNKRMPTKGLFKCWWTPGILKEMCDLKSSLEIKYVSQSLSTQSNKIKSDSGYNTLKSHCENALWRSSLSKRTWFWREYWKTSHKKWSQSEIKIQKIISDQLKMVLKCIELESAYRSGKPSSNRRNPTPIVIWFLHLKKRQAVMDNAK